MEQSEKKKPWRERFREKEESFKVRLSRLREEEDEIDSHGKELKASLDSTVIIPAPGPKPIISDYVNHPIKDIVGASFVTIIIYALGWLFLIFSTSDNTKAEWKWFTGSLQTYVLVFIGILIIAAATGYFIYRSKMKEWEFDKDVYDTSKSKELESRLEECKYEYDKLSERIAGLLQSRRQSLCDTQDSILEGQLVDGEKIFQSEICLAAERRDIAKAICDNISKRIDNIKAVETIEKPEEFSFVFAPMVLFVVIGLLVVFHIIIWILKLIFDIPWNTWGWTQTAFLWGVPMMFVYMSVSSVLNCRKIIQWRKDVHDNDEAKKQKDKLNDRGVVYYTYYEKTYPGIISSLESRRERIMRTLLNRELALPIRNLNNWTFSDAHETFIKMMDERKQISAMTPETKVPSLVQFFDKKITLFYRYSVRSEAGDKSLYQPFEWALSKNSVKELRANETPDAATKGRLKRLDDKNRNFIDIDGVIDDFQELLDIDTSGTFLEHDSKKVKKKTKQMQQCYNSFAEQVNSFGKLVEQINASLGMTRMVAYRNLYFGAELVNIIHETANGGTLTRTDDTLAGLSAGSVDVKGIEAVGMKQTAVDILDSSIGAVATAVNNVLKDKAAMKYYKKNPKEALATAAGVAVVTAINSAIEAWKERNALIARCLETQQELTTKMEELVEQFLDSQAKASRAIELIGAMVKVNEGFMAVYEPLRDKVFSDRKPESVSLQELQQLVLAIKEYKSISDSKI